MLPLAGWGYCKKITVQTAYLDAALTDFLWPIFIDGDTDIGAYALASGYDIRFTASDGLTLLSYERRSFAIAAGAATGRFIVKASLVTSPATFIYIHFGNASAPDVSDPANTYDANFKGVNPLNEAYSTEANNYRDRTAAAHHATLTDVDGDSAQGTGPIDKAVDLNGDADSLTIVDSADHDPAGAMTAEVWIKFDVLTGNIGFIGHKPASEKWYLRNETSAPRPFHCYVTTASGTTDSGASTTTPTTGVWYYLCMVYDKTLTSNRLKLYIQGLLEKQANGFAEDIVATDGGLGICYYRNNYLDGQVAEVRYSIIARSAAWIKFTYYSITEADHEATWGALEEAPPAGEPGLYNSDLWSGGYPLFKGNNL